MTAALITLSLTEADFSEGSVKGDEGSNFSGDPIQGITPIEFYYAVYLAQNPHNETFTHWVRLFLYKFNTSDEATIALQNLSEQQAREFPEFNRTTPSDIEKIGDESSFEVFQRLLPYTNETSSNVTHTFSYIFFRKANVVVFLVTEGASTGETDYVDLTITYAKTVEAKINASLK